MKENKVSLRQSAEYEPFDCPLLGKRISDVDCYELSLVAEEEIKVSALRADMRPDETDSTWRERCLRCRHHPQ